MRSETVDQYEIEFSGVKLPDGNEWAAHVAIYGPSANPMHLITIFPEQRVAIDTVFATEEEAEAEARKIALSMLK